MAVVYIYIPTISAHTLLAHVVLNPLLLALVVFFYKQLAQYSTGTYGTEPSVTCTGGLFLLTTSAHTVLAHLVVI